MNGVRGGLFEEPDSDEDDNGGAEGREYPSQCCTRSDRGVRIVVDVEVVFEDVVIEVEVVVGERVRGESLGGGVCNLEPAGDPGGVAEIPDPLFFDPINSW